MPVPWGPHVLHTSRSRGLRASCRRATASPFPCSAERRKQRPRPCAVSTLEQVAALWMLIERRFGLLREKGKWFGAQPSGSTLAAAGGFGVSTARGCASSPSPLTCRHPPGEAAPGSANNPVSASPTPALWDEKSHKKSARASAAHGGHRGDTGAPAPCRCPGALTSEPLAQDALQKLADGSEVWGGVRAGPPGLPQPQHLTCRKGGAAPLGAQAEGLLGSEQPWVGTVGGAQCARRVRPTLAAGRNSRKLPYNKAWAQPTQTTGRAAAGPNTTPPALGSPCSDPTLRNPRGHSHL